MAIPFHEDELTVVEISKAFRDASVPVFHYPITMREAWKRMALDKKPVWMCTGVETFSFYPDIIPDNRARGYVNDGGRRIKEEEKGGRDMFGIEWIYVPVAEGSMEKPGCPHLFEDANDWKAAVKWPDVDSWDWEASKKENAEFLKNDQFRYITFLNGFGFERLISFMGFEAAAMALVDEEQQDALKELFDRLSDLYCRIIDKCCEAYDIDGFIIHDDWGTQRAPFFSFDTGRELLVPYMKKVTDHIHAKGKVAELHSCGCNEMQIENYIAGGWDIWGPMSNINNTQRLFEDYGDKIILGVMPDLYDPKVDSEETIREKANAFVQKFCSDPDKICIINRYFGPYLQGVYAEELYKASRMKYENC